MTQSTFSPCAVSSSADASAAPLSHCAMRRKAFYLGFRIALLLPVVLVILAARTVFGKPGASLGSGLARSAAWVASAKDDLFRRDGTPLARRSVNLMAKLTVLAIAAATTVLPLVYAGMMIA